MEPQIFISYRREDTEASSGRLYDTLLRFFKEENLFKDVDSIPLGSNFKNTINSKISECDIVLVVIGKGFTTVTNENGEKRIFKSNDFVRLELSAALEKKKVVIPVLVDNATMPVEEDLPKDLTELPYLHGILLRHDSWYRDTEKLHKEISKIVIDKKTKNRKEYNERIFPKPDLEKQKEESYWRYVQFGRGLSYKDYLNKYPNGIYSKDAKKRLK